MRENHKFAMNTLAVTLQDYKGRKLRYQRNLGLGFGSFGTIFYLSRDRNGYVVLEVPEVGVLVQRGEKVVVDHVFGNQEAANVKLYSNLKEGGCLKIINEMSSNECSYKVGDGAEFAIQFSYSKGFLSSGSRGCTVSSDALRVQKKKKMFKILDVLPSQWMHLRWPVRVSLYDQKKASYLTSLKGFVRADSPVKCCSEEFILEIPSITASLSSWKANVWSSNGTKVLTRDEIHEGLYFVDQHSCMGREIFEYNLEGMSKIVLKNESKIMEPSSLVAAKHTPFLVEISGMPLAIMSIYGDIFASSLDQRNQTIHLIPHISNRYEEEITLHQWKFEHHGDSVYSIRNADGKCLYLSSAGVLCLSSRPDDGYPNPAAMFEINMESKEYEMPSPGRVSMTKYNIVGFTIKTLVPFNGKNLRLAAMPNGSIGVLEASGSASPREFFTIIDLKVGTKAHFARQRKSFGQPCLSRCFSSNAVSQSPHCSFGLPVSKSDNCINVRTLQLVRFDL